MLQLLVHVFFSLSGSGNKHMTGYIYFPCENLTDAFSHLLRIISMRYKSSILLFSLYHQMEDYFFSSISRKYHHFNDSVSAYFTGIGSSGLNLLIVKKQGPNLNTALKDGIQFLDATGLPFNIVLRDDLVYQVQKQLDALSFTLAHITTSMHLDMELYVQEDNQCDSHEIQCTDTQLSDWMVPIASAFESEAQIVRQYQARHQAALNTGKHFVHFSLYVKKNPVCSLTLSIKNGTARLDDVGTRVGCQGKGYASALIQYALSYAKSLGIYQCFLEASVEGISIYRKAGFSTLFAYAAFYRE